MLKYVLFNVVLLFVVSTFAAVPPYLKVCDRTNPNLDACILESVKHIESKLREGIPELDIPSIEPFTVKEVVLLKQPDFYAVAKDVSIYGLTKYEVKNLHVDLDEKKIDLDLFFKDIKMVSKYHVDAKILVPVSGTGPLQIKTRDVAAKAVLRYKLVNHKGKEYMYFHSMTTKLFLTNFDPQFEVTDGPDSPLGMAINTVANSNQDELLKAATPNIEKAITETVLQLASKITKHFPYEELFPNHE